MKRKRVKGVLCWGCLNVINGMAYAFKDRVICVLCLNDIYAFALGCATCATKCAT